MHKTPYIHGNLLNLIQKKKIQTMFPLFRHEWYYDTAKMHNSPLHILMLSSEPSLHSVLLSQREYSEMHCIPSRHFICQDWHGNSRKKQKDV